MEVVHCVTSKGIACFPHIWHFEFFIINIKSISLTEHVERAERGSLFRVMMFVKIELITRIGFQLFLLTIISQAFYVYHGETWKMQRFAQNTHVHSEKKYFPTATMKIIQISRAQARL